MFVADAIGAGCAWPGLSPRERGVLEACIELESDPALVGVARHFVDQTVVEWELDPIREDARLIATELVSNAVLHARTEFRLTLRSNGFDFLRIEVRDENTR